MANQSSFFQSSNPAPAVAQSMLTQITQASATGLANINSAILVWLNALPTTLPATANTWWNNGGVLSRT